MLRFKHYIFIVSILGFFSSAIAQNDTIVKQFTGIVVEKDSASLGIPGVRIFVPKSTRGTISNGLGYFSMPVLAGDTVKFRAFGYKASQVVVPKDTLEYFSLIITLDQDTTRRPEVTVNLMPSESDLKQLVFAQPIPASEFGNMYDNLNTEVMTRMLYDQDDDGSIAHAYYMKQQITAQENRFLVYQVPIFDPFAWSRFIREVKDYKERKRQQKVKSK